MPDCPSIDPLITPYVDGEVTAAEREAVDAHVRLCPPCRGRVAVEGAVRNLIREKRSALSAEECASALLRASIGRACGSTSRVAGFAGAQSHGTRRFAGFAAAAALVLAAGGTFVYQATARSSRLMAAELTADHVKCFVMNRVLGTHDDARAIESSMQSGFGWSTHAASELQRMGVELVGSRPCLYGEGRVAHIMCRYHGQPVSIFMLPESARGEEIMDVMGHQAKIWSDGGRTFVLITNEPRPDAERMASVVQAALH